VTARTRNGVTVGGSCENCGGGSYVVNGFCEPCGVAIYDAENSPSAATRAEAGRVVALRAQFRPEPHDGH